MQKPAVIGLSVFALFPFLLEAGPGSRDAFLHQFCLTCHNQQLKSGGLALDGISTADPSARADVWEKVVRKLRASEMPPAGLPRPDEKSGSAFTAGLTDELDAAARRSPYAGRQVVRRLNRTEYSNAIRDLLAIELPLADELPQDGVAGGFDNNCDT